LGAFGVRRLGILVCVLRVLLGFASVLLTLGMIILAVRVGSGTMGLCRRFVMFRRLIVCVFHFDFSCWPENFGSLQITASIVAEYSANLVLIERGGPITTSTAN
jgi:hypothetical protein